MLTKIWTGALLFLAWMFFCAWLVLVCHEKNVHPLRDFCRFFKKQSTAGGVLLGTFFIVLWIYASVKLGDGGGNGGGGGDGSTNNIQMVIGPGGVLQPKSLPNAVTNNLQQGLQGGILPPQGGMLGDPDPITDQWADFTPIASTNTTRTLTAADFARGFVLTCVGTGEAFGFAAPVGANVCADWRAFGAATDWIYLAFEDWAFQLGTNEVDRLRVFSFGKVDPLVRGADGRIATGNWFAPFMASLGVVPQANWPLVAGNENAATPEALAPSQFWHFVTPSNTLQLTWQNVLFGRLTNTPVSIRMEVWPTGKFTYHYDLSRLDVDEVANVVAGASFGGLEWIANAIPTNMTSLSFHALAMEDATNPDRDGDGLATVDEMFVHDTDPGAADTDGDGLSDPDELAAGTDPRNPDTDGDGLVDGDELELGANPFSGDSDADGIGDWSEVCEHGTSPLLADTDGDGLSDAVEIAGTTDPTKADTDDDGLDDAAELRHGTSPANPDTDGDGAPDGWEIANGSNPLVSDTDGDGLADGVEMRLGSSPLLEDTDGDGFSDLDEFTVIGTSPALADTDGDGLSDRFEVDVMRIMPSNCWVSVCAKSNTTVFVAIQASIDDSIATTNLPFVVDVCGVGYDRISIDTNGKVHLIPTNGTAIAEHDYHNKSPTEVPKNGNDILIAAYWDDLMLRPHFASSIGVGSDEDGENVVIGYSNVGLYGSADTNAALTCQIVLSSDTNFPIRINYQSVVTNMAGQSATVGVFDRRTADCRHPARCRSLVWSHEEAAAITNGLSIGFRFGLCTDPLNSDTDGDGLDDGGEFSLGTDPLNPDTDGDGLEDGAEIAAGASPFKTDTDNDGMPDAWEVRYGLNPNYRHDASSDADGDGLTNYQEFQIGTSPCNTDTDGDGLSDHEEHGYGTSPLLVDTDGDGLDDKDEYRRGTSGTNPDSDYDGLPDGWEAKYTLDPKNNGGSYGASGDPDGDGLTNAEEYALGTNPGAKDTDGDGLDDGEEAGCLRRRRVEDGEWAASTNGWTAVTVESDPDLSASWFSFDELLKIGDEWMYDVVCQWNGLLLVCSGNHYPEDVVVDAPADLSGSYVSDAALAIAPYWTEGVANGVPPSIDVFKRGGGGNVRYAIQYTGLPVGGTNAVSFQVVLVFTNGTYWATEISYGEGVPHGANDSNVSIGVQDSVNGVKHFVGFSRHVPLSTSRVMQFIPGTGTDPLNGIEDSDGDGLSDDFERQIGTDPNQPDTDGDGMHDGWEHKYGFNPLVDNDDADVDADETNDSTCDADDDGLANKQEADWGTDPNDDDTDGDGVADGQEVENSSDPNDDTDGGRPASRVPVAFNFGDPSGSHSEKYRLVVRPSKNPNGLEPPPGGEPKTFEWVNAEYGECETKTAMLLRGWTYEVRMYHAGTNEDGDPDYDYSLTCIPPSCVGVVTNDPSGLFRSFDDTSSHFSGGGKVAYVLILDGCVVGDYDRKDGFTDYDLSRVYRNRPLRHWINDDDDEGDINEGDEDVPGVQDPSWWGGTTYAVGMGREPDYGNGHVDGKCDILDFTPVWMDMGFALQQLTTVFEGTRASDYALTLSQPEGAVNVVWTSLTTNNVSQFLSMNVSGCGKSLGKALEDAETVRLTEEETKVPAALVSAMQENRAKGIFLFEGRALEDGRYHGTKYITLRCYRKPYTPGESKHLFELKLPVSTSPVEDMFRWIDFRILFGVTNDIPTHLGNPWNHPDEECNGKHYVFVHGYNVSTNSALGWASEMFKRLRQSGSQAMFTAVDWYGNDSQIEWPIPKARGESPNYYVNVEHAFQTAPYFTQTCSQLRGSKIILAHSLGNILASAAAKDYGLEYQKYYMLNAAVPMEAYDVTAYTNAMVDADWRSLTNHVYAANWWKLFDSSDGRQMLSWNGRFAGIPNVVNCYSPDEDTLGNINNNYGVVASMWKKNFWAAQELNKGTKKQLTLSHWLGNNEGGWGFNPSLGVRYVSMGTPKPPLGKRILSMGDDELVRNPIFRPFDDTWLHTSGVLSSNAVWAIRARILADGIPALSFAAGANEFKPGVVSDNINYTDSIYLKNGYPREKELWRHSDLKRFAYYYVNGFFNEIIKHEEWDQNP